MKRVFAVLAGSVLMAIAAMGEQNISYQREKQKQIGDEAFGYSDLAAVASIPGNLADLADRVPAVQNWILDAARAYKRSNGATGFDLHRPMEYGKGMSILDKGLKLFSMGTDVVSMGSAIWRDKRDDFVDAADSLVRKSCSTLGSAMGVAAASLASGAIASGAIAWLPAALASPVGAAAVLIGGSVVLGYLGAKAAEWFYNDLFGVNLSGQMKDAFGTLYDVLFPPPKSKPTGTPCSSCALGDLVGTCTTPSCPNYGHPHRDYRP